MKVQLSKLFGAQYISFVVYDIDVPALTNFKYP